MTMRTLFTAVMVAAVIAMPVRADDERVEDLRRELQQVHERMEYYASHHHEIPRELVELEVHLQRQLEAIKGEGDSKIGQALELLETIDPDQAERWRDLQRTHPDEFHRQLEELHPWLQHMRELRRLDPQMFELEKRGHHLSRQCHHLAARVVEAGDPQHEQRMAELHDRLGELFNVRLEIKELQIQRLERELKSVRRQLKRMSAHRDEMIARRVSRLLGEHEEW